MNNKDAYRKGIQDTSESYNRRFNEASEWMMDILEKQKRNNENTHQMVHDLAENQELMDQKLDRLYDLMGGVKPGITGSAVVLPNSQQTIVGYTDGMMNTYNYFSRLEAVKFEPKVVNAIAGILANSLEKGMNRKFHENLSIL